MVQIGRKIVILPKNKDMEKKFEFITSKTTANEIANVFGSSIQDTAKAFEIWAKIKHRDCRHKAIDIINEYLSSGKDFNEASAKVMNIKF